jgi:ABC-type glycerol-3-phosphate transport system substrate-binding protein
VYYNTSAFEEAGVALPTPEWTTDDYTDAAVKLTQKDSSGNVTRWGGQLRADYVLGYFYYVEAFGGNVRDDDTQMTCLLGEEPALQALEWIRQGMWDLNCFGQNNQINATGIPNTWTGVLPANIVAFAERSADQFFALSDSLPEAAGTSPIFRKARWTALAWVRRTSGACTKASQSAATRTPSGSSSNG